MGGAHPVCDPSHLELFSCSILLVGSFVWSHLTNVLRSEDPTKQALIESLPDNIVSREFEAEFLKFSSYSDYTVASGKNCIFTIMHNKIHI